MEKPEKEHYFNAPIKPDVVLFTFQVSLIFIVACVSLHNLTLQWGNQNLWMMILTSSLGYIMPNPRIKTSNNTIKLNDTTSNSSERI